MNLTAMPGYSFDGHGARALARRLGVARLAFLAGLPYSNPPPRPRPGRRKAARMRARGY